jgi:hypothetical protein
VASTRPTPVHALKHACACATHMPAPSSWRVVEDEHGNAVEDEEVVLWRKAAAWARKAKRVVRASEGALMWISVYGGADCSASPSRDGDSEPQA